MKVKLGISTASLFLRKNNEEALPLLNEWGIPYAEVFLTSFSEYNPRFASALALGKGNVKVHSVHVLNTQFEPQLYAEHPRVKTDAYDWLKKVMLSAKNLGARNYTFHGIARLKRTFRENLPAAATETAKIFAVCKEYGVQLCYENVEWALYNRPGIFTELKKECHGLGGVLDIKQARISGYDWREYLAEMGEDLATVHVSDVDQDGKMCLPGKGVFPFRELFERLQDVGFYGAVLIENYSKDYSQLSELRDSYRYLCDLAQKIR